MATDTFDAVLAEMRAESRFYDGRLVHDAATGGQLEAWADLLAAAHAAELAERDARIAELDSECRQHLLRALENGQAALAAEARAEAAERDAKELRAILYEAVGDGAKDWESGDGWPMGRFLVPALAGDYATAASEFAAYNAERAAIATTEQADE